MATSAELHAELETLTARLGDSTIIQDQAEFQRVSRRHKEVAAELALVDTVTAAKAEIASLKSVAAEEVDAEIVAMAQEELPRHEAALLTAEAQLAELRRPKDPRDDKNAILEIRAGAGGDEASLFAAELFGMYARYAETRRWSVEIFTSSASEAGGYKEIVFAVSGAGAYGELKFEAGTHRVQRVPATESQGRIHTSTVTVAVLSEVEETEVAIKPEEIRIDVFRSSGPGGQSVNTTDSAVRITHLETGLTVSCQDEKSQHKNRAKAMQILRARLQDRRDEESARERGDERRAQVGTGERSEKVRTYNFPQDRLTDHRIGYTTHGLAKILTGELGPVITALQTAAAAAV